MSRVQIPYAVETQYTLTSSAGGLNNGTVLVGPVVGASVTITKRADGTTATVYSSETGTGVLTGSALVTDAKGNVPGWLTADVQYNILIGSTTSFAGAGPIGFDAVSGGGVSNLAPNSVGTAQLVAQSVTTAALADASVVITKLSAAVQGLLNNSISPIGTISPYAGSSDPPGGAWLIANGRAISRSAYPLYFSQIGTLWGPGDGSTTVAIPNIQQGFTTLAAGASYPLANVGGAATVGLGISNLPAHTHPSGPYGGGQFSQLSNPANNIYFAQAAGAGTVAISGVDMNNASTGGNAPHNNMPPYTATSYIVRVA